MNNTLGIALDAREKGIVCIPCFRGTKVPMVRWKMWQTAMPPLEEQLRWFANPEVNAAIVTTGMVVFDIDDIALAEMVLRECGDTPHKLATPRGGIHLGYGKPEGADVSNRVRICRTDENPDGLPVDLRTDGGIEVIPTSRTRDGPYRWLGEGLKAISQLPVANVGWARDRLTKTVARAVEPIPAHDLLFRRAKGWIDCVEGARSHHRGHDRTFRVACRLTHPPCKGGFGLSRADAIRLMLLWNETCEPPWTLKDIEHKVDDALKKA